VTEEFINKVDIGIGLDHSRAVVNVIGRRGPPAAVCGRDTGDTVTRTVDLAGADISEQEIGAFVVVILSERVFGIAAETGLRVIVLISKAVKWMAVQNLRSIKIAENLGFTFVANQGMRELKRVARGIAVVIVVGTPQWDGPGGLGFNGRDTEKQDRL
jgi:hypothetical protein